MEEPMQRIEVALDSGAGDHVASKNVAPAYAISESAGSRAGQHFVAAGGARFGTRANSLCASALEDLDDTKGKT